MMSMACIKATLLLTVGILLTAATISTAQVACPTCPAGWICVNGSCGKPCNNPNYNVLEGLCSAQYALPFAGVYCNAINQGSDQGVYEVVKYNVANFVGTAFNCVLDSDCDQFGTGYFCNYFSPNSTNTPAASKVAPECSKPAPPACFPLINTTSIANSFPCPPNCPP